MAKDELKTIKFQMMLSESEARAIDDWGFAHRIRSRAEAIRRLCQMALFYDDRAEGMLEYADEIKANAVDGKDREHLISIAQGMSADIRMLEQVRKLFSDGEKPIKMDQVDDAREKLMASRARRVQAVAEIDGDKSE